jgi:hypothetical protein
MRFFLDVHIAVINDENVYVDKVEFWTTAW